MVPPLVTMGASWLPAIVLLLGTVVNIFVGAQRVMPLATPLDRFPTELEGIPGADVPISDAEKRVAGATVSMLRSYLKDSTEFQVYVGYYATQKQGKTIHSPKNCLPGAGWEPLESSRQVVAGSTGEIRVNRFLIANKSRQALVYYWYQGRGRTESSEYKVKFDLMRDSAIRRRSDEALVRIVVPLRGDLSEAEVLAKKLVGRVHQELQAILPS